MTGLSHYHVNFDATGPKTVAGNTVAQSLRAPTALSARRLHE
jgi:hypothetical protein